MDLFDIELAHEVDGFFRDHLARHHDRETWRVGDHKVGGDQIGTVFQTTVDFRIGQPDILAALGIVGAIEPGANVAFVGPLARVLAEGGVEM